VTESDRVPYRGDRIHFIGKVGEFVTRSFAVRLGLRRRFLPEQPYSVRNCPSLR
jgi:hypothetical protein